MNDIIPKKPSDRFKIPHSDRIMNTVKRFSATEKVIFAIFTFIFVAGALFLTQSVNSAFMVPVPAYGGEIYEGVIGVPRFINPILALNDADRDLTTLIYSGLLKNENGNLVPDLAESFSISPDGLIYTFTLKENIFFHDNKKVTADDVLFTIQKAQDSLIKSPRRANWDGITVEKINDRQITFTLKKPYAPFIENTTIGILPKHIWNNINVEQFTFSNYNIEPIGSGPYKLNKIRRNSGGLPDSYELTAFKKYVSGTAYISDLIIRFYPNEETLMEAYKSGLIDSINSISTTEAKNIDEVKSQTFTTPLPRVFGVFFNQNQSPVLMNKEVREALNMVVDKDQIIKEVLNNYATKIDSPIPFGTIADISQTNSNVEIIIEEKINEAKKLLEKNGWTYNSEGIIEKVVKGKEPEILRLSISTSNVPELKSAAEIIKKNWESIGASVTVKIFDAGDLNQNVIRPRKYDALLFGEIIGRDLDLFAFWHSSQRNDPGLNIAMYVNSKTDKLLEEARTISNPKDRMERFVQIEKNIKSDIPAIFLYSPDFIYVLPNRVKGAEISNITNPGDRFSNISKWYIKTDKVWKVFVTN